MSRTPKIVFKNLLSAAIIALMVVATLSRCAQIGQPQGGPKDSLPPILVSMVPHYGATNFTGKRIYIEFDEYVQLKDQQKEFFTSPMMKKKPVITVRGKGIQVDIKDTLLPDQTYSLNFGRSVVDNHEGNPYTGLRYVFSTGDVVDSMLMSGYTVDAYSYDTVGNGFILFYDPAADSIPDYDSTLFNAKPLAVGKAFPNGIFLIENLAPQVYKIFALEDHNGNQQYEPGVDRIAFLDSLYDPQQLSPFGVWYDTTRHYLQAQPQLMLRYFMEPPLRRQTYASSKRVAVNKVELYFTAPFPRFEELAFNDLDPSRIVTEYMTPNRDSMILWIDTAGLVLPDTLTGRIIYQKQDSVQQYFTDTVQLKLGWKAPEVRSRREERGTAGQQSSPASSAAQPAPNAFQMTGRPSGTINPTEHITLDFEAPLTRVDSTAIELQRTYKGQKKNPLTIPFQLVQDSMKAKEFKIIARWEEQGEYRLFIPEGTFRNVLGQENDMVEVEFGIEPPDKYARLIIDLQGESPQNEYIVQLVDESGKIISEQNHLTTGKYTFSYITPGNMRVKVIQDLNCNGKWDGGSVVERQQPERVEFMVADNSEIVVAKMNWDREYTISMEHLFAPMTMERMAQMIDRREILRSEKLAKELENEANRRVGSSNSPTTGSMGRSGTTDRTMGRGGAAGGAGGMGPLR